MTWIINNSRSQFLFVAIAFASCVGCSLTQTKQPNSDNTLLSSLGDPVRGRSILQSNPSEAEICIETARSVAKVGHSREAMLLYEKSERLSGESLNRELAPLYAATGQFNKSIDRYRQAIHENADDIELVNNLAWTLMEAGKVDESIELAQQGLAKEPQHKRLKSTLAVANYRLGNREAAFDLFRSAYGESAAHHNLAMLDIDAGNEDRAKQHLSIAVQSPDATPETDQFHRALFH